MKRRTEITVETEQVLILRRARRATRAWCPKCRAEVGMVAPEDAATLGGLSLRAVCRRVEAGELHFRETADGRLFICLNSLGAQA
jgi:hypothetical protein